MKHKKPLIRSAEERTIYNRLKKRESRENEEQPKQQIFDQPFEAFSSRWPANEQKLARENPGLLQRYIDRHEQVTDLELVLVEFEREVSAGQQSEMIDLLFLDIKNDVQAHGHTNFGEVEAKLVAPENFKGQEQLNEDERVYRDLGFRLRLSHESLQRARESLVLYALRTKDPKIDSLVLEEAIEDCLAYYQFSPNRGELTKLMAVYRSAQ